MLHHHMHKSLPLPNVETLTDNCNYKLKQKFESKCPF
jgi:hypothetical protein